MILLLVWCGVAGASDQVRLALTTPPTAAWHSGDSALDSLFQSRSTPWIRLHVNHGDTLSGLFDRVGLAASQWRAILALGEIVDPLRQLSPGVTFRVRKTAEGRLAVLHFPLNARQTLAIHRSGGNLVADVRHVNATTRRIQVHGVVGQSLTPSLLRAGAPAAIANALAHIFAGSENLARNMQPGDRFNIIYSAEFVDGERVHVGPVIAASIHTGGQTLRAFRQVGPDHEALYYDSRGRPYQPSILRTPLNYTEVTSPFSLHRVHPILGVVRKHTGVDLAAPRGTPVHAAADGTVTFEGWISGYGRIVKIQHGMGYSTRYAHLADFANSVDEGDHVEQGQTIAYVGASGLATGYHLHFEIRKNGTPHDPLTMALPDGKPLSGAVLTAFTNRIQPLIAHLNGTSAPHTLLAANTHSNRFQACAKAGTVNSVLALSPGEVEASALGHVFCTISS